MTKKNAKQEFSSIQLVILGALSSGPKSTEQLVRAVTFNANIKASRRDVRDACLELEDELLANNFDDNDFDLWSFANQWGEG